MGARPRRRPARALRRRVVDAGLPPVRRLAHRRQRAAPAEALDRRHADGGRAAARQAHLARARPVRARRGGAGRARERLLQRQPPVNLGLFHTGCGRRPRGAPARARSSRSTPSIQAVGEGNYGRLGASQQRRYTSANVEPMFSEPYTATRPTSSPARCPRSCRRRTSTPARRQHPALHALPLDGHAGVGQLRDDVARRAPAARRAAGPGPRPRRAWCRRCRPRGSRSRARTSASASGALALVAGLARRRRLPHRRRHAATRR